MNKKLAASAAAIIILSVYLIARSCKSDSVVLKPLNADVDHVLIQKGEKKLFFAREGENWFVNEHKYPADGAAVESLIDKIKELELADLISNQPYYERYGLDAKNEMTIALQKEGKIVRKVSVGSFSQASRHTFIRVDDKPEVYQTDEVFSAEANMDAGSYRDKSICKIKEEDIVSFSISYNGKNFTFNRNAVPAGENLKEDLNGGVWQCDQLEGTELDKGKMASLVSSLASLRASKFNELESNNLMRNQAVLKIFVKSSDSDLALSFFGYNIKKDDESSEYLVISSDSKYEFIAEEWKIQKFFITDISAYKAPAKEQS